MATTLSPVSLILHFRPSEPKIVNFADPWWSNFCYLCYLFITQQAAIINITNPRHIRPIATASRVMIVSLSFSEIRNTKHKKIITYSLHYRQFYQLYSILQRRPNSPSHPPSLVWLFSFLPPCPLPWDLRTQIIIPRSMFIHMGRQYPSSMNYYGNFLVWSILPSQCRKPRGKNPTYGLYGYVPPSWLLNRV